MAAFDEQPLIELGAVPIPGAAPCGSDVADDEQYINVLAEVAKLGRLDEDDPDWFRVEDDAKNILRSKSKDVEIGAALGTTLFKRYSYAGLAAAFGMLTGMVNNFWDDLFPVRPRRRKARIETLTDRFSEGGWFRENQPKPDDFDGLDLCVTRIDELNAAITEKMPDDPPDFTKFIRGVKELAGKRPQPTAAAPPPARAGEATDGESTSVAPTPGGGEAFAVGAVEDTGAAVKAMLSAATFLRKANAADPIPYAVVRIINWSNVSVPTTDEAKYQIPPPEATTIDALGHQMANSLWEHLLQAAEGAFRANDPLWLDLQRYVCAAMTGLGPTFENAKAVVMGLTANLVNRLGEGIYDLKFRSGVQLCSGETRMWIESEVAAPQAGGGGGGAQDNGKLAEVSGEARKLAGSGKLKEALQQLQEGLTGCVQRRDRFLWRLCIAQLCSEAQRLQLASPLLEECYQEVQRFHVDEWEPSLAVEVAQTLYRCRKGLLAADKQGTPEAAQRVRDSFAWLCQLDPLAALAAEPTAK